MFRSPDSKKSGEGLKYLQNGNLHWPVTLLSKRAAIVFFALDNLNLLRALFISCYYFLFSLSANNKNIFPIPSGLKKFILYSA